ncbi:MAG: UDP-N-acetylglucosamine 2-epimerase [Pyrinomonadaceae bacterium]
MDIPCMTLRDSTERPETITVGTNVLVGTNPQNLAPHLKNLSAGKWKKGSIPKFWDGRASERIVRILLDIYQMEKLQKL